MTDTDLYQIVKDHREAWPDHYVYDEWFACFALRGTSEVCGHGDTRQKQVDTRTAWLAFEAAFHRALMARGDDRGDVYAKHFRGTYTVQIDDHEFYGGSLIEAYAKALEWLK